MIEARPFKPDQIRIAYDRRSWIYSKIVAPLEFKNHRKAIEKAAIHPGDKVLEVAVGPGKTLLEIVKRVGRNDIVHGVDTSPKMLEIARNTVLDAGYQNIALHVADARDLDFPDGTFDVLYNGYMLDLIPLADMPNILSEFKRVLKPGGRLVLLNMSKKEDQTLTLYERMYTKLPASFVLHFMGACRPVLMEHPTREAGFQEVERVLIGGIIPSEVVTGLKA
jgi:demethylmenaquinone methyltransferase/2-methoxy-6-polyprenyl-1,4-benzoquinol methylase